MQTWRAKLLLAATLGLLWTTAYGEFYQYTDKNGMRRFTDDLATVPPDQRPNIRTHQSAASDPVQPVAAEPSRKTADSEAEIPSNASPSETGTWNEKVERQAEELDRMQMELNRNYRSLQAERDDLAAKSPPSGASDEELDAYNQKVKVLNAKIEDYEARHADFMAKEKAFNDQYQK